MSQIDEKKQGLTKEKKLLDFGATLTKAFKYPWKHRALWFFGVLLAIFAGGSGGGNYPGGSGNNIDTSQINPGFPQDIIQDFFNNSMIILIILIIGFVIVIFAILALIIGNWARAAVINGTLKLENSQEITRKEIGKTGKKPIWGLIKLNFLIPVAVIFGLIIIFALGFLLFYFMPQPAGAIIGVILALILLLALIPVLVYLCVIWPMANRFVVAEDKRAFEAISLARGLIKGHFWMTFLYIFVSSLISGGGGCLGSLLLIFFLILTVIFIATKIYIVAAIMGVLAIAGLAFYFIVAGYFAAFTQTGLTIWWNDLKKLKETKE